MILDIEQYLEKALYNENFKYDTEDSNGSIYEADMYIYEVDILEEKDYVGINLVAVGSYYKGDKEISLELKCQQGLNFRDLRLEVEELDGEEN